MTHPERLGDLVEGARKIVPESEAGSSSAGRAARNKRWYRFEDLCAGNIIDLRTSEK